MTKKKARDLANEIAVKCDNAYLFACKIGSGYQIVCNPCGDSTALLSILLGVVEETLNNIKLQDYDPAQFKRDFLAAIVSILEEVD